MAHVQQRSRSALVPLLLGAALIVGLAFVAYHGARGYPLMRDDRTLLDNRWLVTEADVGTVWSHDYWHGTRHAGSDLYRPLTVLSLAWNARQDATPPGFRDVQIVLHAIVALLAWWTLTLAAGRLGSGVGRTEALAGWIAAALFVVHPLLSESVVFMVGRAEILAAGFGLGAFGTLLLSVHRDREPGRSVIAGGVASALLLFLAMLSKESSVAWLLLLALWVGVATAAGWPWRRWAGGLIGWPLAVGAFLVLRGSIVGWATKPPPWIDNPLVLHDPVTRIANAVLLLGRYAGKMVFPRTLSVEHGFDQIAVVPLFPWGLLAALALTAAWGAVALLFCRRRLWAALWTWVFAPAAFGITANVLIPIGVIFAERLTYLPLIGACGFAGVWIARIPSRAAAALLLALVLTPAVIRTRDRTADFSDYATYVEATAEASPRAVKALSNVGRTRFRLGRPADAREPLERAVEIWPEYPRALSLLGQTYDALGDPAGAAEMRRRSKEAGERFAADPESTVPR